MVAKVIAVTQNGVKLSAEVRERLETLIRSGKRSARKMNRARILLKADASDAGEAWSDNQIAAVLDTALSTVAGLSAVGGRRRRVCVDTGTMVRLGAAAHR